MLDFRTCKFSELLNLYIDLNKVINKSDKQVKLFRTVKRYLNDRFRHHFTLYLYAGEVVADDVRDSDLHNRALSAWILQGAMTIGRQKVYVDYSKPIGERCTYVSEFGTYAVTDEEIAFNNAISKDYH